MVRLAPVLELTSPSLHGLLAYARCYNRNSDIQCKVIHTHRDIVVTWSYTNNITVSWNSKKFSHMHKQCVPGPLRRGYCNLSLRQSWKYSIFWQWTASITGTSSVNNKGLFTAVKTASSGGTADCGLSTIAFPAVLAAGGHPRSYHMHRCQNEPSWGGHIWSFRTFHPPDRYQAGVSAITISPRREWCNRRIVCC